jgi:hypothetical protein
MINPNAGSKTSISGRDALVDGAGEAMLHAATGGKYAIAKVASRWLNQGGIKGVDAERLSRDAISNDPDRLSAAIDFLEQKGMARERATKFVNNMTAALAGRTAGASVSDNVSAPPSARSLYVTPTKQGAQ